MKKANVLHIIESLSPYGGTPRKLLYLARNIDKNRYHMVVAAFQIDSAMENQFENAGARIIALKDRKTWDVFTIRDICSLIKHYRIVLVNTHFIRPNIYGRIAAIACGIPAIVNEHGLPRNGKPIARAMDNVLGLFTGKIICNSHAVLREAKRDLFIRRANFEVVQNGIDVQLFLEDRSKDIRELRKKLGISPSDIVIANVSGFIPIRNHKTLIHAFAHIHQQCPRTRLLLVGDGPLRMELTDLSKELGIESSIHFTGYRNDVPSILRLAHIYVDPTIVAGGFGFNVMEAMLSGLPVIAASAGVPPDDIVRHNVDGILVPPRNPASMAEAVERLIRDGGERKRLGQAGRRKVLENYTAEMFVENICRVYNEALGMAP
jgi:glycosyltransferase involved in cell wall biosynthesis